jgi:polyisoprenoid-binding protein YceI
MRYILVFLFFSQSLLAQQFLTKTGEASFFSFAPLEDIEAVNNKLGAVIDLNSGKYAFKIAIQDFVFPNSLMQEHFNESYLESEKYPYAVFQGEIISFSSIDIQNKNKVVCKGDFTIHGVTNNVEIESDLQMIDGVLSIESSFNVLLNDYKIKIPKVVLYNIAEEIKVSVVATLTEN